MMKFLTRALAALPEMQELEQAVNAGRLPAAVTGLSAVHKAALLRTLCARTGRRALVLTGD